MQRKCLLLTVFWVLTACAAALAGQKQPAQTSSPVASKLDDELVVEGYSLQPPRNYTVSQQEDRDGSEAFAWLGAQRKDKTRPVLMLSLIPVPAAEVGMHTAEELAGKFASAIKRQRTNWKQEPLQKPTIGGLTFVRIGWSGYQPTEKRDMQGVLYVALDGDTIVEFATQDVLPYALQTLPIAEAAVHTFKRPSPRVFYSVQWPGHAQIYAMDPDGSHSVCLTPNSDTDYCPALSPDGKTIAFSTHRDGVRALYTMHADGTDPKRLTDKTDSGLCCWAPSGSHMAFSSNRDGNYCIYVMNSDGSQVTKVTKGPSDDCPNWSSDGSQIAYEGRVDGKWRIFVVNLRTGATKAITSGKWDDRWPQWSPDGKLLVYTSYEHGKGDLSLMQPDGTHATQLTMDSSENRQACFTADGRQLLYHSNRAGKFDIYVLDLETLKTKRLTTETKDTAEVTTRGRSRRMAP